MLKKRINVNIPNIDEKQTKVNVSLNFKETKKKK